MSEKESYTVSEAAEILGYSTRQVYRKISDGALTQIDKDGGVVRIPAHEVDALALANKTVVEPQEPEQPEYEPSHDAETVIKMQAERIAALERELERKRLIQPIFSEILC